MDFSEALQALRAGERLTRLVWHPDAFITLMPGYPDGIAINATTARATRLPAGTMVRYAPYFLLVEERDAAPWLCGDEDILGTDWMIYETSEEATAEIMADPQAMADIAAAGEEIHGGVTLAEAREIVEQMRMRRVGQAVASYLADWRESNATTDGFTGTDWAVRLRGSREGGGDRLHYIEVETAVVPSENNVAMVLRGLGELSTADPEGLRPIWRREGFRDAIAALVDGIIEHHLRECEGSATCLGCCPECCNPCVALKWFRDNDTRKELDSWIAKQQTGNDWQHPDGTINWEYLGAHWKPEKLGCIDQH